MQNYENLFFSRLLQNEGGWVQAVYVAAMFAILIWRRERIVSYKLFRASYFCFAGSIVLPPIVTPLMQLLVQSGRNSNGTIYTFIFASALAPICYAAAVVCGLASMMPERVRFAAQPAGPHPLD
jgi:ABC-type spermidine/putrescine transport system permease subunit II